MIRRYYFLLIFTTINLLVVFSQPVDSTSFASNTRLSFTLLRRMWILLHVPARFQFNNITAIVKINGDTGYLERDPSEKFSGFLSNRDSVRRYKITTRSARL